MNPKDQDTVSDRWQANVVWFNQGGLPNVCFGVVRTRDPHTDEVKYYIGAGQGIDERMDFERIRNWGATFPREAARALFNR